MFWKKKKKGDKGLPDLPPPKAIPSMRDFNPPMSGLEKLEARKTSMPKKSETPSQEDYALPSFPDSPMKRGPPRLPELPGFPEEKQVMPPPQLPKIPSIKRPKTIEMEEWKTESSTLPIETAPKKTKEKRPIFVKLDKFQSAQNSLEIVKEKLDEIDSLLRKIREVKIKEDQELSSWEKEIEAIKARINSVVSEIFENPRD